MEQNQTWQVILNPHAGSGKGLKDREKILKTISNTGVQFTFHLSEYPGHAVVLAQKLVRDGATHFIIAGGDGTLNEVVNGLFNSKGKLPQGIIVGMIPVGTGNDWSRTFGIARDYEEAMEIILHGKTITQDVGEIVYQKNNEEIRRYFINIAGFGFDAMVATKANQLKEKGLNSFRVYIESLLTSFLRFKSEITLIDIDKQEISKNLFSASIGIGKYNGGGMMQVPDANPVQGVFHITLISRIGILGILKNLRGLYNGKFVKDPHVSTYTGTSIRIKPISPMQAEADGESLGSGHFKINILPHQLTVICGDIEF